MSSPDDEPKDVPPESELVTTAESEAPSEAAGEEAAAAAGTAAAAETEAAAEIASVPEQLTEERPPPKPKKKKKKPQPASDKAATPARFRGPEQGPSEGPAPVAAPNALPVLTLGIAVVLLLVYGAEATFGIGKGSSFSPSIDTLIALGGVSRALVVGHGEWWRLFTATLLHGDPVHLLMNGVCLFLGGALLESIFGRAWLAAIFVLGAIGGSLASITVNDPSVISVGASGAIMGLIAAAMVASFRLPELHRNQALATLGRVLIPSLIPIATRASSGKVDVAAHFGGAIVGGAVGFLLLRTWPRDQARPRFGHAAMVIAAAGAALYALSFGLVQSHYAAFAAGDPVELFPDDKLGALKPSDAQDLLRKYPHDPRAHWLAAMKADEDGDTQAAEKHLRAALSEEGVLKRSFPDRKLEGGIRTGLALLLDAQRRSADARAVAHPVCDLELPELEPFCR